MSYIGGSPNSPNLSDVINVEEDEVLDIFLNNEQNDFGFNKVLMQDQTQEFYASSLSPGDSWSSNSDNSPMAPNNDLLLSNEDNFLESIRYGGGSDKLMMIIDDEEDKLFQEEDEDSEVIEYDLNQESFGGGEEVKVVQLIQFNSAIGKTLQIVHHQQELNESEDDSNSLDDEQTNSSGGYQELKLSDEEKRLLSKEGITLPSHYPLTKFEERELKRIRRKIRNKISAQDSRKRKKEYLDKLQQRVLEIEEEKTNLSKKVRTLETSNAKLSIQVKRLQMALNQQNQSQQKNVVPAATTLLVLILSLALVVLPTNNSKQNTNAVVNQSVQQQQMLNINSTQHGNLGNGIKRAAGNVLGGLKSRTMLESGYESEKNLLLDGFDEPGLPPIKLPRFSFQHHTNQEHEKSFQNDIDKDLLSIIEEFVDE